MLNILPAIFGGLIIVLFALATLGSPAFQECYADNSANSSEQQQDRRSSLLVRVDSFLTETRLRCVGRFVNESHDEILAAFTILLAFFTYTLWRTTARLAEEAKDSAKATLDSTKDTARRQLRAYVSVSLTYAADMNVVRGAETHIQVIPVWRNNGNTPTRQLRMFTDCAWHPPKAADPFTTRSADEVGFIGPQSTLAGKTHLVPELRLIKGYSSANASDPTNERLYVWGAAEYRDVFSDDLRRTEFCVFADFLKDSRGSQRVTMDFVPYGKHNRADEECND